MDLVQNWEDGGATPIAEGSTTALWSVQNMTIPLY
jgi:beta-glucosidase